MCNYLILFKYLVTQKFHAILKLLIFKVFEFTVTQEVTRRFFANFCVTFLNYDP
jgi:hypothetical protein